MRGHLFEKIRAAVKPKEADLLIKALTFSKERLDGSKFPHHKVAELLLEQGADPITIASALLAPILCRGCPTV